MQLTIATCEPFSFGQTLRFMRRFPCTRRQYLFDDASMTAAVTVGGKPTAFTLREGKRGVTIELANDLAKARRDAVVAHAAHLIGASDDLAPLYTAAAGDAKFTARARELHGLHHVRFLTLAEIAVYAVMMQRAPAERAVGYLERFLAAFGKPVTVRGTTLRAMPELDEACALSPEQIGEAIGHAPKGERIAASLRGVRDLGEEFLRHAPYAQARDALLAIRGLGPFSAAAILLRGLGRMDELPWLPQFAMAARRLYGREVAPETIAKRYGNLIGYWSFYAMVND